VRRVSRADLIARADFTLRLHEADPLAVATPSITAG